jgi:hypothetical protein
MLNLRALVDRLVEDVLDAIRNATLDELAETRGEPLPARWRARAPESPEGPPSAVRPGPRGRKAREGRASAGAGSPTSAPSPARRRDGNANGSGKRGRATGRAARPETPERFEAPGVGDITDPAALLAEVEGPKTAPRPRAVPALLEAPVAAAERAAPAEAPAKPEVSAHRDLDPIRRGVVIRRARPA